MLRRPLSLTFESFEPSEALLDKYARFIEYLREIGRFVLFVGLVGDHRGDAPSPGGRAIGLTGISLIPDGGTRDDVRSDVQKGLEMRRVRGLAAGEIKRNFIAGIVRFRIDFGCEPATRASERLALLPLFAPAAET